MTTLVWLFLGMSVLITSFITWKITNLLNIRKIKSIINNYNKLLNDPNNQKLQLKIKKINENYGAIIKS